MDNTSLLDIKIAPSLPVTEGIYPTMESSVLPILTTTPTDPSTTPWIVFFITIILILIYNFRKSLIQLLPSPKKPVIDCNPFHTIEEIQKGGFLEQNNYRQYSIALIDVFRTYFLLEKKTYPEALIEIDSIQLPKEMRLKVEQILLQSEEIKFAGITPSLSDCESILHTIQETLKFCDDRKKRRVSSSGSAPSIQIHPLDAPF
jgi:hypothetical protein